MDDYSRNLVVMRLPGLHVHASSVTRHDGVLYFLVEKDDGQRQLAVTTPAGSPVLAGFEGVPSVFDEQTLLLCPLSAENAAALRKRLAWLLPAVQGLRTTVGLGDRLGLATPGHLRAVREAGGHLVPLPAQQSIREMIRIGRTPQQDMDRCVATGYTFYTFDPGEYVESGADNASPQALRARWDELPWEQLEDSPAALAARYLSTPVRCDEHIIRFDELTLMRAAVKYGRAIAYVALLYRHLAQAAAGREWEVELSVDETETPTTSAEHVYIATELRRLGVRWVSLAPRYIGRFEKGVNYIGDVNAFEAEMGVHAAIARTLGPYKLSLHSRSDKFSVYEPTARQTRGLVHLKTAGTSYLEALRTIAALDPDLLRSIYVFARER